MRVAFNKQIKLLLPSCHWQFSIELAKVWIVLMMLDVIDETMNGSDEVWRQVQKQFLMSLIIQKLQLLNEKYWRYW